MDASLFRKDVATVGRDRAIERANERARTGSANPDNFQLPFDTLFQSKQREERLYHVTLTSNLDSIREHGILNMQPTNWVDTEGNQQGEVGYIYAFTELTDAIRWASKMDWDFHKEFGTKKISVIAFNRSDMWEQDEGMDFTYQGTAVRRGGSIGPGEIIGFAEIDRPMLQRLFDEVQPNYEDDEVEFRSPTEGGGVVPWKYVTKDADFWIQTKGKNAGKVMKEKSANSIGVKTDESVLLPDYAYYMFLNAYNNGVFERLQKGTAQQYITQRDITAGMVGFYKDSTKTYGQSNRKVYYHGSRSQIDHFQGRTFFTSDIDGALSYAGSSRIGSIGPNVTPVYFDPSAKTLDLTELGATATIEKLMNAVEQAGLISFESQEEFDSYKRRASSRLTSMGGPNALNPEFQTWEFLESFGFYDAAESAGYDLVELIDTSVDAQDIDTAVALNPRPGMIKSAITGEFMQSGRVSLPFKEATKRIAEVQESAKKLKAGEITREEHEATVNQYKPFLPYEEVPTPATPAEMKGALAKPKLPYLQEPLAQLEDGEEVSLRLDIPAYSDHGVWVVTVHKKSGGKTAGKRIGYDAVASIRNATFAAPQEGALEIAAGKAKAPIARIEGEWKPYGVSAPTVKEMNELRGRLFGGAYSWGTLVRAAKDAPVRTIVEQARGRYNALRESVGLDPITDWKQNVPNDHPQAVDAEEAILAAANRAIVDPAWIQVGYDPERHSYFWNRKTGSPVVAAAEIIQIGPLVLARDPQYGMKTNFLFQDKVDTDEEGQPRRTSRDQLDEDIQMIEDLIGMEGRRGTITFVNNRETVIRMLEAADQSTFLHEAAHLFLEMRRRAHDDARTSEEYKRDSNAILHYLGVDSFDDITVDHHELFAESFEKYLMEGKSPSLEARGIFRQFANWLMDIYRSWSGPTLNPSIRAVFDRMVATDEQIEAMQAVRENIPIFYSAEEAGMTPQEWAAYLKDIQDQEDEALEILRHKVLKQLERRTKAWWKEERDDIEAIVSEELAQTPVYKAISFLLSKSTPPGWQGQHKLDRAKTYYLLGWGENPEEADPAREFLAFIAKNGGISIEDAKKFGTHPIWQKEKRFGVKKDGTEGWIYYPNPENLPAGAAQPLFKHGGKTLARWAEYFAEQRYVGSEFERDVMTGAREDDMTTEWSEDDAMDLILGALAGEPALRMDEVEEYMAKQEMDRQQSEFEDDSDDQFNLPKKTVKLRGMTIQKGGADPEVVARRLGYFSAREMLFEIVQAKSLKQAARDEAEARMIAKHGDILNDGTLESEARLAVMNEKYGNKILRELRALARLNNAKYQEREEVRKSVAEEIDQTKINEIRPALFHRAEVKSAEAVGRAKEADDMDQAQAAAQEQYKNFTRFRLATLAKKRVAKVTKALRDMRKRKFSDRRYDPAHIDSVRQVLDAFIGFNPKNDEDRRSAKRIADDLIEWIEKQNDYEKTPDSLLQIIVPPILTDPKHVHMSEMTVDQLEQLNSVVESIMAAGKALNEKARAEWSVKMDNLAGNVDAKNEAIQTDIDNATPAGKEPPRGPKWLQAFPGENTKSLGRAGSYSMRKFESLIRQLDGMEDLGPLWKETVKPLLDAARREMAMHEDAYHRLEQIFRKHTDILHSYTDIMEIKLSDGRTVPMPLSKRIMVALNWGNEGNRRALLEQENRQWKEQDIAKILDTLKDEEWGVVQDIWDFIDSYWNEIAEQEERISGVAPRRVEPTPFTAPTGRKMQGGYFPLIASKGFFAGRESQIDVRSATDAIGATANAYTRHPWTKERRGFGGNDIELNMEVLFRHVDDVIHDLSHREAVRHVNRVLENKNVKRSIKRALGLEGHKALKRRLATVATGEVRNSDLQFWDRALRYTRVAATYGALSVSIKTGMLQLLGITTAAMEQGFWKTAADGMFQFYKNPIKNWEFIVSRSIIMQNRRDNMNRDVGTIQRNLKGITIREKVLQHSFDLLKWLDLSVSTGVWWAAYHDAAARVADPADTQFTNEQDAIDWADRMVSRTQQSGLAMDLSGVEAGGEFMKNYSVMYSALNAVYNMTVEQTKKYKADKISGFDLFKRLTIGIVIAGILEEVVFGEPWEEDEEWFWGQRFAWASMRYGMGTVIALRDMAWIAESNRPAETPVSKAMKAPFEWKTQVQQGEVDKGLIRATTNLLGFARLPGNQINRMLQFWLAYEEGDEEHWDWYEFLVTGPKADHEESTSDW